MNQRPMVSTIDEAAVIMHELFVSHVRAGFNEEQALRIVIAWMLKSQNETGGGGDAST